MSSVNLTEEFAAAVDRLNLDAVDGITQRIADSDLEPHTAADIARFLRTIASRIMMQRVQREAGLTSSTRKQLEGSVGSVEAMRFT